MNGSKNTKEALRIKQLELDIASRKKNFGIEYLNLKERNASEQQLRESVDRAMNDIDILRGKVSKRRGTIAKNRQTMEQRLRQTPPPSPEVYHTHAQVYDNSMTAPIAYIRPYDGSSAGFVRPEPSAPLEPAN